MAASMLVGCGEQSVSETSSSSVESSTSLVETSSSSAESSSSSSVESSVDMGDGNTDDILLHHTTLTKAEKDTARAEEERISNGGTVDEGLSWEDFL